MPTRCGGSTAAEGVAGVAGRAAAEVLLDEGGVDTPVMAGAAVGATTDTGATPTDPRSPSAAAWKPAARISRSCSQSATSRAPSESPTAVSMRRVHSLRLESLASSSAAGCATPAL